MYNILLDTPGMKLSEYLALTGLSVPEFARRAGMTPEGVRLILRGKRRPRRATEARLIEASGGKVTAAGLISESTP